VPQNKGATPKPFDLLIITGRANAHLNAHNLISRSRPLFPVRTNARSLKLDSSLRDLGEDPTDARNGSPEPGLFRDPELNGPLQFYWRQGLISANARKI
jgi:hypothetical protein